MNLQDFLELVINANVESQNNLTPRERQMNAKINELSQTVQKAKMLLTTQAELQAATIIKKEEIEKQLNDYKTNYTNVVELILAIVDEKLDEQYIQDKKKCFNTDFITKLKKFNIDIKQKQCLVKCLRVSLFNQIYMDEKKLKEQQNIMKKSSSKIKRVYQKIQTINKHIYQSINILNDTLSKFDSSRNIPRSNDSDYLVAGVTALSEIVKQYLIKQNFKEESKIINNDEIGQYKKKVERLEQKIQTMKQQFKFEMGELKEKNQNLQGKLKGSSQEKKQLEIVRTQLQKHKQTVLNLSESKKQLEKIKPQFKKIKNQYQQLKQSHDSIVSIKDKYTQREMEVQALKIQKSELQIKIKKMNKEKIKIKTNQNEKKTLNMSASVTLMKTLQGMTVESFDNEDLQSNPQEINKLKKQLTKLKNSQQKLKKQLIHKNNDLKNAFEEMKALKDIKKTLDSKFNKLAIKLQDMNNQIEE